MRLRFVFLAMIDLLSAWIFINDSDNGLNPRCIREYALYMGVVHQIIQVVHALGCHGRQWNRYLTVVQRYRSHKAMDWNLSICRIQM